jgi:S1-C subfamily serine protease
MLGDVMIAIANTPVGDIDDVHQVIGSQTVGQAITAQLVRGGALIELVITVGERSETC